MSLVHVPGANWQSISFVDRQLYSDTCVYLTKSHLRQLNGKPNWAFSILD